MAVAEVTDATFESDVLKSERPVIVDFWAPWCVPCRRISPILEEMSESREDVRFVKVNVDDNPRVAATFQVQSIPAVFALRDQQVVDSFIGAVPEATVREFVARLAPAPSEADRLAARGDEASLRQALELEPAHPAAVVALAELLIEGGETAEALELLSRVPETGEARRVAALARVGNGSADGNEDVEARLSGLLDRVREDDAARQEFVDLLEVLGPDDPRTPRYRKALTSRLF